MSTAMLLYVAYTAAFLASSLVLGTYATWGAGSVGTQLINTLTPAALAMAISVAAVYGVGHFARAAGLSSNFWPRHELVNRRRYLVLVSSAGALTSVLIFIFASNFAQALSMTSITFTGMLAGAFFALAMVGVLLALVPKNEISKQ